MIAIIDYGAGNMLSVENALRRVGAPYIISSDPALILSASHVIFPGVGEAAFAMNRLREGGLDEVVKQVKAPLLGICLGMQLLCAHTEESDTDCLGIMPNRITKLQYDGQNKVPNTGWCELTSLKTPLFKGIEEKEFAYYVHSYAAQVNQYTICQSLHTSPFSGALNRDNFYGCQFHPEKSGLAGEKILKNFLSL